ncbi:MAG: serine/threonine-protein kinase [Vicinamibacterales bacterium]
MALTPGTRLGVYEVTAQIGEGGMGRVYRATDTTLGRQVAIKILPDAFAAEPERIARFEREAKTLASLNHPNIAAIYGFETSAGMHALVMELVEGEDLSQRITRGAIPIDEALPIAKQIAEALEAAHEQGIMHRDLKPANIKVRADGTVKVLDFGLAKAMEPVGARSASASMAPTITTPAMTQAGMILGTAAYMSPEQARGHDVDKRADLWAFGVVLWEMLTGQRLFEGATVSDTLAAVLKTDPAWSALAHETHPAVRRLLRRCLEKDRKRRLDSAAAVRLEIEEALTAPSPPEGVAGSATSSAPGGRLAWMVAFAIAAVLAAALAIPAVQSLRETPPPETRVDIVTPATGDPISFALSPQRPPDRLRGVRRRRLPPLAAVADVNHCAAVVWNRRLGLALLVARQSLRWLLRRGRAEAARPRRRCPPDPGAGLHRSRWDLERGRRHRVCARRLRPAVPHCSIRGSGCGRDDTRSAAEPPTSVLPS